MQTKFNFVAFVLILILLFTGCSKKKIEVTEITYQSDLKSALEVAHTEKKPLVIDFYKIGCPWGRLLDDSTFSNKIIIDMSEKMIFLRIDAGKDTAIASQYGITFYPTIVLIKPDGSEIDRLVGYYPPADFYNEVQLYLQGRETLEDYLGRLQDEPQKPDYIIAVAEKYRNRSEWDKSLEYYKRLLALNLSDSQPFVQEALFEIAVINGEKGDYPVSLANFQDLLGRKLDSLKREDVMHKIPYYMAKSGDTKQALTLYQQYLDQYPNGGYANWVRNRMDELRNLPPPPDSSEQSKQSEKQEK
jgi:tetratricopeptide (TPR) repeat protein